MANRTVANLTAVLSMNNSKFKKGITGSQKTLKGFSSQVSKIGGTIAAAFSIGAITSFTKASFRALDTQLKAEQSLLVAMNGRISAQQMLIEKSKELQKTTLYGDEETIRAAALIGTMVKEEETIKRLLPLVQDFATAKGMQLSAAADLVAKSIGSSTNALSRYGITITGAVGSSERLETTVTALNKAFGGQAVAAAQADKMLTQIKNSWGDLQEAFAGWLSSGGGGFIRRGVTGGIEDLTRLFTPKTTAAMVEFQSLMDSMKDKSSAEQVDVLNGKLEEQRKAFSELVKERKKWQSELDERGPLRGGRVAKMEIKQIEEQQDALLETIRLYEGQINAISMVGNQTSEIVPAVDDVNEAIEEGVTLMQAMANSAYSLRLELEAIASQRAEAAKYFADKAEKSSEVRRTANAYLYDNDEEWTGGEEEWESAAASMNAVSDQATKLGDQVGMMLVNQFDTLGMAIGKFASGAEDAFRGLGDAIMQNLGNILIMMGAQMGAAGLPLVLAGAALQLGGGILRGLGSKVDSTSGTPSGYMNSNVQFQISGQNLVGVLNRQNNRMDRFT